MVELAGWQKQKKVNAINEKDVINDLRAQSNKAGAKQRIKFFQAHKGGYGEGDFFLGLTVPQQRKVSKKYCKNMDLKDTENLLQNKFHEARFVALAILTEKYKRSFDLEKKKIVKIYLNNAKYINNWDLVDVSAPYITGEYWFNKQSKDFWKLANSQKLWQERISALSLFYFIRQNEFNEILRLAEFFINHKHHLMHKAVGWMLREAGKRNICVLYEFLDIHHKNMPRTMLRYSIEKLPEKKRMYYMEK